MFHPEHSRPYPAPQTLVRTASQRAREEVEQAPEQEATEPLHPETAPVAAEGASQDLLHHRSPAEEASSLSSQVTQSQDHSEEEDEQSEEDRIVTEGKPPTPPDSDSDGNDMAGDDDKDNDKVAEVGGKPLEFNGKNWDAFMLQLRLHFALNSKKYPDDAKKVMTAISYIKKEPAASWVAHRTRQAFFKADGVAIRTLWGGLKGDCSSSLKRAKGYNKRRGL